MRIFYISNSVSQSRFSAYLKKYNNILQQQAQKYHWLFLQGLVSHGAEIRCISMRPIGRFLEKRLYMREEKEQEAGIDFDYLPFFNVPLLRNISAFFGAFRRLFAAKRDAVIVCDALSFSMSLAVILYGKIRKVKTVAIVTDIPCYRPYTYRAPLYEKLGLAFMKRYDAYILLTEEMNKIVNPRNRPHIVLEGHTDITMRDVKNDLAGKYEKKVCLYAGSLRRIYGIEHLVKGFLQADIPDTELHIYGQGNYSEELTAVAAEHPTVKYFGVAANSTILEEEIKAALLVNPRPTNEEYTKYSFPSKNMEYMASGTPVLTTRLPGMPAEYEDYVYIIEEESAEGVRKALTDILTLPCETLHDRGMAAKAFVMTEKNNIVQTEKVMTFLQAL